MWALQRADLGPCLGQREQGTRWLACQLLQKREMCDRCIVVVQQKRRCCSHRALPVCLHTGTPQACVCALPSLPRQGGVTMHI